MQILKSPLYFLGKMSIALGIAFSIVFSLPINSIIFIVAGICMYLYAKCIDIKLNQLKIDGIGYDTQILRIKPLYFLKIKGYMLFHVECSYQNKECKIHFVKSRLLSLRRSSESFLIGSSSLIAESDIKYHATVFVNRNNSQDYIVEVCAERKLN